MKYLLIINPNAGKGASEEIIKKLKDNFQNLTIKKTKKAGDATRYARITKADIVIAAGGDGTVNEVINGLIGRKSKLAILPLGTSNLLARYFKIPSDIGKAIEIIKKNKATFMDICKINKRHFTLAAGVGIDAHMYKNVEPGLKKLFGEIAYPLSFLKTMFIYEPNELKVKVNNKAYTGYYAVVCNTGIYGSFNIIKEAKIDDGYLDILIFKEQNVLDQLTSLAKLISIEKDENIIHIKAKSARITSKVKVLGHADAELIGETPFKIGIIKKAVRIIH